MCTICLLNPITDGSPNALILQSEVCGYIPIKMPHEQRSDPQGSATTHEVIVPTRARKGLLRAIRQRVITASPKDLLISSQILPYTGV